MRFYRHSRLTETQFRELVRLFASDVSATETAALVGLTRRTVTVIFLKLRRRLVEECERRSSAAVSRIQQETSLASARCVCGRCRPGRSFGSPVFGVLADQETVFAQEIPDCRKPVLRAIVRHRLDPAFVPGNGWHGFDALVEAESSQPFHVSIDRTDGSQGKQNVQNFWSFARQRLQKFKGVPNRTFYLHLKECEWRFNFSDSDLYSELLCLVERNPL